MTTKAHNRALAEELREYTAMKYAGDCKCGKCQLVPRVLVERIYHTLNSTGDDAQPTVDDHHEDIEAAARAIFQVLSPGVRYTPQDSIWYRKAAEAAAKCFADVDAAQPPAAPVETEEIKQLRAAVEYWRLAAERRDERRERTGMDIPEAATLDAPEYCSAGSGAFTERDDLIEDLTWVRQRVRNCRGAVESNQVEDKDVRGGLLRITDRLDEIIGKLRLTAVPQEVEAWCQPMDNGKHSPRKFLLYFEDADRGIAVFDNEDEARTAFEKANTAWNCYLFGSLPLTRPKRGPHD